MASQDTPAATQEAAERKRAFRSILGSTIALEFGLGLQRGIFNNFVVEALHIQPDQLGFVQSVREIPGLLTAPLAVAQGYFRENVWAGLCLITAAGGLLFHAAVSSVAALIAATLVLSTGFHLFYPVQSSIVMKVSLPEERATKMGQLNSGAAAASLMSVGVVMAVSRLGGTNYSLLHVLAAVFPLLGGLAVVAQKMGNETKVKRSVDYNPRYMSYYILSFLSGARRHITMTFAGFLLVETFHTPVSVMVLLSACASVVAIVTRPLIGRVVDTWGEQRSLVLNYSLVVTLFLGYALVRSPLPLYVIYVLDNGLMGFDVAITTHLGRIAPKEVLSAAYAMGNTINHVTGVAVPAAGGLLWKALGGPAVFLSGAAVAMVSLLYSRGLHRREAMAISDAS